MKYLEILRDKLATLHTQRAAAIVEMDAIAEVATTESRSALTVDEDTAFAAAEAVVRGIDAEIEPLEVRIGELTKIAERSAAAAVGQNSRRPIVPGVHGVPTVEETRGMTPIQVADAVTRSLEERGVPLDAVRPLLVRHKSDMEWSRNLLVRSSDVYMSAWSKLVSGRSHLLNDEERAAAAVGTNTSGGFLVPTHLDPTLILTNTGSSHVIRPLSRVVTLTREKTWNGVGTAGVSASWDGELAEVSDDTPAFTNPSIPTYQAQALVQASFSVLEDVEGFASDVLMMFADARDRLEAAAFATGSGSGQPKGIFTAINAVSGQLTTSTTAATIGLVDLQATRRALGIRWRQNASWISAPVYADAIKTLGTAISASYTTDLTQANAGTLLGRPFYESENAPTTQTTTVKDQEVLFGDFSNYVIVDKVGSTSVDFIKNMFNTSNNLPDGRSAWFMTWRTGADASNTSAFTMLVDKTTA